MQLLFLEGFGYFRKHTVLLVSRDKTFLAPTTVLEPAASLALLTSLAGSDFSAWLNIKSM